MISMTKTLTPELSDAQWEAERDAITHRFYDVDAARFVEMFRRGEVDEQNPALMTVLAYFPELD